MGNDVIISFPRGAPGYLRYMEVDTAHFKGNYPESCEIHALHSEKKIEWSKDDEADWQLVLPRTQLGPHRQHYFDLPEAGQTEYTHIKITIHPDGGIKRIRAFGQRTYKSVVKTNVKGATADEDAKVADKADGLSQEVTLIPLLPLTPEAFAPFGKVIQAYEDDSAPKGTKITAANEGTATKFHKLSLLASYYEADAGATSGLSVYRCRPVEQSEGRWGLKVLERHQYTTQAFIPMGGGGKYMVVVAPNGSDDRPETSKLRGFWASDKQGVMYDAGIWRELRAERRTRADRVHRSADDGRGAGDGLCVRGKPDWGREHGGLRGGGVGRREHVPLFVIGA
jgi:allantoicase